ncbi:hypothetical protein TeGR_g10242 [Tetraparma gracilis]|jgi:hypothetical protein|uniref:Uncharacterized protein n=1 Tax=Tetraparma gracilis TaxID=2962635 RepID=A0ABQ6MD82_9STRA|nr:hypothetical protein TeGR_g10242 [Tetraparma gracilis]
MMPDTMVAKLCEQAAARHELKRKAEERGEEVDEEDLELAGLNSIMGKAKPAADEDEEGGGGKRQRRNT